MTSTLFGKFIFIFEQQEWNLKKKKKFLLNMTEYFEITV